MTIFRFSLIAAALLLAACGEKAGAGNGAGPELGRVTAQTLRASYTDPDDWHRLALYGNWDFVDAEAWRAIATQPDCDRATALAIFWKASPEYYAQFADRTAVPEVNRDNYDLITLIRERWQAGAYTRAELAFDPDADAWPVDLAELRRQNGARVDLLMPATMRAEVPGRRLGLNGRKFPGNL